MKICLSCNTRIILKSQLVTNNRCRKCNGPVVEKSKIRSKPPSQDGRVTRVVPRYVNMKVRWTHGKSFRDLSDEMFVTLLNEFNNNKSAMAEYLGVSIRTVRSWSNEINNKAKKETTPCA